VPVIHNKRFLGIAPKISAHLLREEQAQIAQDVNLWSQSLRPLVKPLIGPRLTKEGPIQTLHRYRDDSVWLCWLQDVNATQGPINDDPIQRLYFTGTDKPRVTTNYLYAIEDDEIVSSPDRNYVLNGDMQIAQRGTAFTSTGTYPNNDDAYLLDQWVLLSDGNDIVDVSQETTTIPADGLTAAKLDVETANKKFGIIQFIENRNIAGLIGQTVTLSFKARKGAANATVDTLRCAVLVWDGTADALTSDIVSAWNVEGTNPTPVANWTIENTPANLALTNAYQTFTAQAAIDTPSAKNLAVFIWCDNGDATVGDLIYITDVDLYLGTVAQPFEHGAFDDVLMECQRHFETSFDYGTAPADGTGNYWSPSTASVISTGVIVMQCHWQNSKRVAPSVTFFNSDIGGTAGQWAYRNIGAGGYTAFTPTLGFATRRMASVNGGTGLTGGNAFLVYGNWTSSAEL